jgi:hypothetical protein
VRGMQAIQFEPTLEERVEVSLRFLRHTAAGRALRLRTFLQQCAIASATGWLVVAALGGSTQVKALAGAGVVGLVVGIAVAGILWQVGDWGLEDRLRSSLARFVAEHGPATCEIQLREDALRVHDMGVELTLPWNEVTGIDDSGGSVELAFRSAIVVARDRAFASQEDRALFVRHAKMLSGIA